CPHALTPSHAPASSALTPLSLHDALPILEEAGGQQNLIVAAGFVQTVELEHQIVCGLGVGLPLVGGEAKEVGGVVVEGIIRAVRSEEHTSELQSRENLVCRLPLEKKKTTKSEHQSSADPVDFRVPNRRRYFAKSTSHRATERNPYLLLPDGVTALSVGYCL